MKTHTTATSLKTIVSALILMISGPILAAPTPMEAEHWALSETGATLTTYLGVPALQLRNGGASMKDVTFRNGTIEFDVAMPDARGFTGVLFRNREGGMAENFYLRSHLSEAPDANQYQPIWNGNSAWQLYHGARYSTPTRYDFGGWNHVKLVVKGSKMDVYVNSEEPVLHVDNLFHGDTEGGVRFTGALVDFFYANVEVTPDDTVTLKGEPAPLPDMAEGLITSFNVGATPVANAAVNGKANLDRSLFEGQRWTVLAVSEAGMANLGRLAPRARGTSTLLARMTITADEAKTVKLTYGFSDQLTLFLNGRALVHEDDTYITRDYRYLGTMGLFDSAFLALDAGDNELVFAVTEGFGGWGLMAAIEDQTGLTIK